MGGAGSPCPVPSGGALPTTRRGGALEEVENLSGRPPLAAGDGCGWGAERGLFRVEANIPKAVNTLILPLTRRPSLPRGKDTLREEPLTQSSNRQR